MVELLQKEKVVFFFSQKNYNFVFDGMEQVRSRGSGTKIGLKSVPGIGPSCTILLGHVPLCFVPLRIRNTSLLFNTQCLKSSPIIFRPTYRISLKNVRTIKSNYIARSRVHFTSEKNTVKR